MLTKERFAQGMTFQQYLDQMGTNKEKFVQLLQEAKIKHEDRAALEGVMRARRPFPRHGYLAGAAIVAAEVALVAGSLVVGRWFTPIVWTGYVLLLDAVVARLTGRSYVTTDRLEGVLVALASVGGWWLFEVYNAPRFWRGGADPVGVWWR